MPVAPSPAQSAASRANGARSHGPATPEGKARSAQNGTRHGLRGSTFTVLPDEDPAAWAALLRGYLARLRPADATELACVERLAACDWREARLLRLETEMLFTPPVDTTGPDPRLGWSRTLPRYQAAVRRDRQDALEQLETLRSSRPACRPTRPRPTRPGCAGWPSGSSAGSRRRRRHRQAPRPNPSRLPRHSLSRRQTKRRRIRPSRRTTSRPNPSS